jgi:hypothetical protein
VTASVTASVAASVAATVAATRDMAATVAGCDLSPRRRPVAPESPCPRGDIGVTRGGDMPQAGMSLPSGGSPKAREETEALLP